MKKFVTTALATAVAGSGVFADPGDNEWLELDSEISGLASSLVPSREGNGVNIAGLIRATYAFSGDNIGTGSTPGAPDLGGLQLDDADISLWGGESEYGWRVSVDILDNSITALFLEDAYVFWNCGEFFTTTVGQFKPRVLRSGFVDPENQLMIDRTALGSMFDKWDMGLGVNGSWENLSWFGSVMNGSDSTDAPSAWMGRAEFNLGEAPGSGNLAALKEGALGGGEDLNGTAGVSFYLDDSGPSNTTVGGVFLDVSGNFGPFGFGGEIGFLDDVASTIGSGVSDAGADFSALAMPITFSPDSVPWSLTGSYLVTPEIEVGARFELLDNEGNGDLTIASLAANYYQKEHHAKWQFQVSQFNGDGSAQDGAIVQLGVVVGGSR